MDEVKPAKASSGYRSRSSRKKKLGAASHATPDRQHGLMLCLVAQLAVLVGMSGCATRHATVDQRMLLPDTVDHYQLEERQLFLMPRPLGNMPPEVPVSLRGDDLAPVTVCAEITITTAGAVDVVVPLRDVDDCASSSAREDAALQAAIASAMLRWCFEPAAICTFRDARARHAADGNCPEQIAKREAIPVKLAYAFTFELRNGRTRVTAGRMNSEQPIPR